MLSLVLLYCLLAISSASHLATLQRLLNVSDVHIPDLNFSSSRNNALELLGGFQDFSFYRYTGQENFTRPLTSTTDSRGLVYYSNNTFLQLINGSNDTDITKIVPLGQDSFILSGSGHIEGHRLENQLVFNLTDITFKPIFNCSLSTVNSILVDESLVYFGGSFSYSNGSTTGHSAALWDSEKDSTFLLPFVGFGENSSVNSIVKLDNDNVLFAGEFYELDAVSLLRRQTASNSSISRNLTDIELGLAIPLQNANWTYGQSQFNSSSFICPNPDKESWLQSGTTGSLECTLPQENTPNKVRIYNSPVENDQVSLFRIITNPSQGIMNLTYVDPETGELRYCDAFCPLYNREKLQKASSNSSSVQHMTTFTQNGTTDIKWGREFQEFGFVNSIPISSVEFMALSSYGENVGLSSFQLFESSPSIYANNSLNKPACAGMNSYSYASLSNNNWKQGLNGQTYVSTEYIPEQGDKPKVTFYPHIQYPGDYSITLYTPGCLADGTCSQRAIVNVTLWSGDTNESLSTGIIYENNDELKYNEVYSGHLTSSPRLTLEYDASIYPNNPASIIVADYISVVTNSVDELHKNKTSTMGLNGLFQYEISNFTEKLPLNQTRVGNTSLNQIPLKKFPSNSSLFASLYDNNTLLLAGSDTNIIQIKLDGDLNIDSSTEFKTDAQIKGMGSYSKGLILFGNYNSSSNQSLPLSYNGTLHSFDKINKTIGDFANVTFDGSELLLFDNEYVYNVTSDGYFYNTTVLSLSIWSAGQNALGDLLFSGVVSKNDYPTSNGPFDIYGNGSIKGSSENSFNPYMGTYLNDSLTAYAFEDRSISSLMFSDEKKGIWKWSDPIRTALYLDNETLLAVGTASSFSAPQLTILNLTTFEVLSNQTLNNGTEVSTMVIFPKNSTLLVGGTFSIPKNRCNGLCLFNYEKNEWFPFANGTISGNISKIQLRNPSELLISGSYNIENSSNVNLASFRIAGEKIQTLLKDWEQPLESFIVGEDKLIAWNTTNLITYDNTTWKDIPISTSTSPLKIQTVEELSIEQTNMKRGLSLSNSNSLLVYGNFETREDDAYQALVYNDNNWEPFFVSSLRESSSSSSSIFMNKDISDLHVSDETLPNPNKTLSSSHSSSKTRSSSSSSKPSTATSTASSHPSDKEKHHHEVDRGFVVLIGLALAVGTVAAIGIVGVLIAYIFGEDIGGYELLNPPSSGSNMVGAAAPEKLP